MAVYSQYSFIIAAFFVLSSGFTKISVLLFYRRLVAGTCGKKFKWALWAGIGFIVAFSFVLLTLMFTACTNLEANWLRVDFKYVATHRGRFKCATVETSQRVAQFGGILSVLTDFYAVVLPAMLLHKIKISRRQKIGLMYIFGLGLL